jgi:hypothetical protein
MHKLKAYASSISSATPAETEETEYLKKQNRNPFALLQNLDDDDDDEDDPYAQTKEEREIVKHMSKEDKKKRKEVLQTYEQLNNNMYVFPKQSWRDTLRDPITEYSNSQLHKNSEGRKELTIEMFNIDSKRKDLIKQENELSYLIEQNTLRLIAIVRPYIDPVTRKHPPIEHIPATLTENPNALYQDILSQTKELIYIKNQYTNFTNQYELSREIRDLLNDSIMLTLEEQALERKLEFAREVNSHALRSTLARRKKNLEQVTLDVQTNKNLVKSGKVDSVISNGSSEEETQTVNQLFSIRFDQLLRNAPPAPPAQTAPLRLEDVPPTEAKKQKAAKSTNVKILTEA